MMVDEVDDILDEICMEDRECERDNEKSVNGAQGCSPFKL